jgi:hypothetical protein
MYIKKLGDKEACAGLFLDLSKAPDLVNHNILLQILHAYGIRGTTHHMVCFLLKKKKKNKKQLIEIDYLDTKTNKIQHKRSEGRIIQYRVPQGYTLGSLFIPDTD